MGQEGSRTAFDSLVTKNHVQHALIQEGGKVNDLPLVSMMELPASLTLADSRRL